MAPAARGKRKDYEKVQNYNISRQEKLMSIDILVLSRNNVLNALKPILEELSNDKYYTLLKKFGCLMRKTGYYKRGSKGT